MRFLEHLLCFKRANQAMVLSEVRWPNGFPEKSFTISSGLNRLAQKEALGELSEPATSDGCFLVDGIVIIAELLRFSDRRL